MFGDAHIGAPLRGRHQLYTFESWELKTIFYGQFPCIFKMCTVPLCHQRSKQYFEGFEQMKIPYDTCIIFIQQHK